jgi:hypothetical protein
MAIGEHLERVRYFLRDPQGKIWSDEVILEAFNEVCQHLQQRTNLLAEVRVQAIPPRWPITYQQEFEQAFLPGRLAYRMNWNHRNNVLVTQRWEMAYVTAAPTGYLIGADPFEADIDETEEPLVVYTYTESE